MMKHHRLLLCLGLLFTLTGIVGAQIEINDPALILRDTAIAALKRQLVDVLTNENDNIQRMAKRLSASTNLDKYVLTDIPMWRIHTFLGEQFLFANSYDAALNYGDGMGAAFAEVARVRTDPASALATLGEDGGFADAAIRSELATLDAADSTIIEGTDQTGQLRYNGRKELAAIDALETDTVDPSATQSTTAVLDKISGATLIRARQQQARIQFLAAITEQLLVDNKRARDSEAAAMNMALERLRWGRTANSNLTAGSADALRTWRQP